MEKQPSERRRGGANQHKTTRHANQFIIHISDGMLGRTRFPSPRTLSVPKCYLDSHPRQRRRRRPRHPPRSARRRRVARLPRRAADADKRPTVVGAGCTGHGAHGGRTAGALADTLADTLADEVRGRGAWESSALPWVIMVIFHADLQSRKRKQHTTWYTSLLPRGGWGGGGGMGANGCAAVGCLTKK